MSIHKEEIMSETNDRLSGPRSVGAESYGVTTRVSPRDSSKESARKPLRIGFVGLGGRGRTLLSVALTLEGVEVPALLDINEENLASAEKLVEEAGLRKPQSYSGGERDYRRLCDRNDLDVVVSAGPWETHTPVALAAMEAGKDTAVEVPAALTLDECWQLVETSEKTGKHCSMLENACYGRESLLILNLVQKGLLGEPLYAEAGYVHDLRAVKFNTAPDGEPWRLDHSIRRNGNLYPTHPIGPAAWWMDVNRGDRFDYLVSMSTKSRSMKEFAVREFGDDDRRAKTEFAQGDVNMTLIRTVRGRTITLHFDTNTPHVKEHFLRLQGTKGVFHGLMNRIFIEGLNNHDEGEEWRDHHEWDGTEEYRRAYDSRLWREVGERATVGHHGGMDFMTIYRFVKNLQEGRPPDIDVYDAAAWSVISPLSERSVANRSAAVDFPDFTRGRWTTRPPVDVDSIC